MKTFLVVTLYASLVAALDLSGAVWNSLRAAHSAKVAVAAVAPAPSVENAGSAIRAVATIPSDS